MAPPRAAIYLILTLALTVVVLTSASVAVQAQGVLPTATVLVDKLNVRAGPGTGYTRLGGVSANDSLTVVGQAQNCAWLKIETKTLKGWVSGQRDYLRLSTACSKIPAAAAPTLVPAAAPTAVTAAVPPAVPTATPVAEPAPQDKLPVDKGCYLIRNAVGPELNITTTNKDNGKSENFRVPAGGDYVWCTFPGRYAITIDAPPPWSSMNADRDVALGDRIMWTISGRD
jgi:uncharacterized protein YraI